MKKAILLLSFLGLAFNTIEAQKRAFIPDQTFRVYLKENYQQFITEGDSLLIEAANDYAGDLIIENNSTIYNFDGLQYFTNLKKLSATNFYSTSDSLFDQLVNVEEIDVSSNYFCKTFPNLSKNTKLKTLRIYSFHNLESVGDLSADTALINLGISFCSSFNNIPDLSKNTALENLNLSSTAITELPDLTKNIALRGLNFSNTPLLKFPDLSSMQNLEFLSINGISLVATLDFSANPKLKALEACCNNLSAIPSFANDTFIETLNLGNTQIKDFSGITRFKNLKDLRLYSNNIKGNIDISGLSKLQYLEILNNEIDSIIGLNEAVLLDSIWAFSNNIRYLPDLSNHTQLKLLNLESNQLVAIQGNYFPSALVKFAANHNQLQKLPNFQDDSKIEELELNVNRLLQLPDLSKCKVLKKVFVEENNLTELPDFSADTNLLDFRCQENYLDFTDAKAFRTIYHLPKLKTISCIPQNYHYKDTSITICPTDTLLLQVEKQDSALLYEWFLDLNLFLMNTETPELQYKNYTPSGNSNHTINCYASGLIYEKFNNNSYSIYTYEFPVKKFYISTKAIDSVSFSGLDSIYCNSAKSVQLLPTHTGGNFSGAGIEGNYFNPALAGIDTFSIRYEYPNTNGCISIAQKEVIVENCPITTIDKPEQQRFQLYPLPCHNYLTIASNGVIENEAQIEFMDLTGRIYYKGCFSSSETQINTSNFPSGLYILQISEVNTKYRKTVIIQH